ncbi:MAG: Aldehyde dehydrogenase [uncultured Thermomicrobiales bacterium]|uniref:Aldehyde dehydrogenase n=1 Tax=uncultured Thermomicrobiales bacterium TaxID=1645740 RepID=A0A6J4V6C9_9BACT|nr:MAG: Aldehyde dehydrogenase [uncultured Thermomicrobiales bacterium]
MVTSSSARVGADTQRWGNLIGGEWVPAASGGTFENRSPADTDDLVGHFAASAGEDVERAVTAAAEAAAGWRATSPLARAAILSKAADIIMSRVEQIGRELTREEGKTLKEGIGETTRAAQILRYYAGDAQQPDGEHYPSVSLTTLLYTVREPLGVVAVITPWNFPIAIPTWKVAPALAYGNTVVLKPASFTPLCAVRLAEALQEAGLPPGVLNLVTGSAKDTGDALVRDPRVTAITFTGSNEVGQSLKYVAAETGAKLQLELGGKNPAIVLADADLDHALTHVVNGAMMSTGQKCTATSRAIVDRRVADRFTGMLTDRIAGLKVGDPLDAGTTIGPLISADSADRVATEIERAASDGATLLTGGDRPDDAGTRRGHFLRPALFGDVASESRLGQEELFGPVLGVLAVDGMDEAISVANNVRFGLSASLFTRDLGRALRFARDIQAGIVHINSETAGAEPQVPFGGMKGSSSYSREQGKAAREFFTQVKTVYMDPPPDA